MKFSRIKPIVFFHQPFVLALALGLTWTVPLQAQGVPTAPTPDPFWAGATVRHDVGALSTPGSFDRAIIGDLTGDGREDAGFVEDGHAQVISAVNSLGQRLDPRLPDGLGEVVDIALLPPRAEGLRATLLAVLSGGLQAGLYELSFSSSEENGVEDRFDSEWIAGGAWSTVIRLTVGDVDDFGDLRIVGLLPADGGVACMRLASDNLFKLDPTLAADSSYSDLKLVRWEAGDAVDSVVLSGSNAVQVIGMDGTLGPLFEFPDPVRTFDVFDSLEYGCGRIAVVTWRGTSESFLYLRSASSGPDEGAYPLGVQRPSTIVAMDFMGDGNPALLLLPTWAPQYIVLWNMHGMWQMAGQPSEPQATYLLTAAGTYCEPFDIGPTASMQNQAGLIAAGDVDGDGDEDFVFGCDATGELFVKRNPLQNELLRHCKNEEIMSYYHGLSPIPGRPDEWNQKFAMCLVWPAIPLADADCVLIELWQWKDLESPDQQRVHRGSVCIPVADLLPVLPATDQFMTPGFYATADYTTAPDTLTQTTVVEWAMYFVTMRLARSDGDGGYEAYGPEGVSSFLHQRTIDLLSGYPVQGSPGGTNVNATGGDVSHLPPPPPPPPATGSGS